MAGLKVPSRPVVGAFDGRVYIRQCADLEELVFGMMSWATMGTVLRRFPLPTPRIVHRYGT